MKYGVYGQAALALALALAMAGGGLALAVQPEDEVVELLSATASAPSKSQIDQVMGANAAADLIEIANDNSGEGDPGVRIRAYSALRHFADTPESETVRLGLVTAVSSHTSETTGTPLLYLRAAMFSLAEVGGESSATDLLPLLAHTSRDIRAACAHALGITGSATAIQPLRDRALIELELQVKLAIADALFELDSD